ncbi:uncharacterized protein [Chlorocebus sabaeus]|uniref:uncharacterized protein isoform X1 n=1 Tax=Chlorocebus sabaeus TaxID=60711 RepID=UPI003BF95B7B
MSDEVIPVQENQTPIFSNPIKASIVRLRKQRGQTGRVAGGLVARPLAAARDSVPRAPPSRDREAGRVRANMTQRSITARGGGEDAAGSWCVPHCSLAGCPGLHPAPGRLWAGRGRIHTAERWPRCSQPLPRRASSGLVPAHSLPRWNP